MAKIGVKIVGDSSSLERSFSRASRSATGFNRHMHAVNARTGGFARGVASSSGALSRFGGALALTSGAFFAGAGVVAGFKAVVGKAAEYQSSLNILQAVTGATAAQMKSASATAAKLGGDITLPATSAKDAAAAMTELAKGGLSIRDSMTAARGTLQLASAAQLDGASAAQIQANALNQFHLAGSKAGLVADVLANSANAASGEVTDMATALSYVGPVAAGVGETIGNTGTAIALLAKNGILGDKAGTALRSMIAGLAHPSKRAEAGIKALGIQAFDSKGKFVGFRAIVGQLHEAQGKLTKQQFASAAALAFGREPLAAIVSLAGTGVKGFDQMAAAVTKSGGAARVAAAHNKGFQGALDGLKSAIDTIEIAIGLQLLPTLTRYLRQASAWLGNTRNQQRIQHAFKQAIQAVGIVLRGMVRVVQIANRISGSFRNTIIALTAAFIALKAVGVAKTLTGWSSALLQMNRRARAAGTGIRFLSRSKIPSVDLRTAAATSKLARLRGSFARLTSAPYLITFALVAIGAQAVAQKIKNLQETALNAKDRQLASGSRASKVLVPRLAAQIQDLKAHGVNHGLILGILRRQFQGSAIGDDLIAEAFRYTGSKKSLDKKIGPKLNDAAKHVAAQTAKAAAKAAALTRAQRAQRIERRNNIFDALIDQRLGRVQYLSGFRAQLAALGRISGLLTARIAKTKDVTRKLNLEDKLFDVRGQIRDLRRQQREAAVAAREARLAARSRKQFLELGLTGEGEERTPGKANLKKRLGNISEAIKGTFLDNAKTKGTLARIRKVLSEGLVPKDVRAKIREMLDGINDELKNHGAKNATAFKHVNSRTFANSIAGLSAAQRRAVAAAFAQTGAGGTRPGHGSAAFAGAGATTVNTTINLDGKKVAHNTTHHQRKAKGRRSGSRRGPYAGHD